MLENTNSVLIINYHPSTKNIYDFSLKNNPRIILFESSSTINTYDILAHTDVLITDYSSIYFDFLLTGKPAILNFIDYSRYAKSRGLCYQINHFQNLENIAFSESKFFMHLENILEKSKTKEKPAYSDYLLSLTNLTHKYFRFKFFRT